VKPTASIGEIIICLYPNNHNKTRSSKGVEIIKPTTRKVDMYIATAAIIIRILITSFTSVLALDDGFDSDAENDLINSVTAKIAEKIMIIAKYAVGKVAGPPIAVIRVLNGSCSAALNTKSPRITNAEAT